MEEGAFYRLSQKLGEALTARGWRVAVAESCTGGGLAKAITDVPGSSAWFECGFVTYANEAKTRLLGVDEAILAEHGAVSEATARAMAAGALEASPADLAASVTGIAGPGGGSEDKPVGLVFVGWQRRGGDCLIRALTLDGDRAAVRAESVQAALWGLIGMAESG